MVSRALVKAEPVRLLTDPRLFAYVLIALMSLQALRFGFERRWVDAGYWLLSAGFAALVTLGYQR